MLHKVLIVTYHFHPRPGIAPVRLGGLAKYLLEFGWEPVVLTAKLPPGDSPGVRVVETEYRDVAIEFRKMLGFSEDDNSIVRQMGFHAHSETAWRKVSRKLIEWTLDKFKEAIYYPDAQKGWYEYAIKKADELMTGERIDAVISSSSPETCHLIAKYITEKYRIPWIADFRDLWTQNHYRSYGAIRNGLEKRLELATMTSASALTTVSQPLADKLSQLHAQKRVLSIPNGFDPQGWEHGKGLLTPQFSISYTGAIYDGKRDPTPLFIALARLIERGAIDRHRIDVSFYGHPLVGEWLQPLIKK